MLKIRFLAATEGEFLSGIFIKVLSGVDVLRFRSAPTPKVEQPRQTEARLRAGRSVSQDD